MKELNIRKDLNKNYQYFCVQRNHWQCMCDLSNNDYDIHYFEGREIIDDDIITYLRNCDMNKIHFLNFINSLKSRIQEEYDNFIKENGFTSEYHQGCLDEINLAIKIIKQDYTD